MSYLRRNIRDLTSKLIAANGGELSDTMKEALSDFSATLLLIEHADREEAAFKSKNKRQRRRAERRKMGEDLRARQEEYYFDEFYWRYGWDISKIDLEQSAANRWYEKWREQERAKYHRETERAWRELEETYPEAFGHCKGCVCTLIELGFLK